MCVLPRREMIPAPGWHRLSRASQMLPIRSGQKLPQDPVFKRPPQWIHESVAAKCFLAARSTADEMKRERKIACFPGVIRKDGRC
jgi:hypothetical protein